MVLAPTGAEKSACFADEAAVLAGQTESAVLLAVQPRSAAACASLKARASTEDAAPSAEAQLATAAAAAASAAVSADPVTSFVAVADKGPLAPLQLGWKAPPPCMAASCPAELA